MANLWLILDVETTGLDPATAGVWQLGFVLLAPEASPEKRELEAFEQYIQPAPAHWTPAHIERARRISGLTLAEEVFMPWQIPLGSACTSLVDLLHCYEATECIATSYNRAFEETFLEGALDWEGRALSDLAARAGIPFRWGPCLMAAAVQALAPERERLSLKSACERLGIPWSGSHRALADARLAAAVGERLGVFAREE